MIFLVRKNEQIEVILLAMLFGDFGLQTKKDT
jgi:hypothetical protein